MHIAFQSPYPLASRVGMALAQDHRFASLFALLYKMPNAQTYVVGGTVRDALLGRMSADPHIVVTGISEEQLAEWRRREEKGVGGGLKDFDIRIAQEAIEENLIKRDITLNAIGYDVRTGRIIDPAHGLDDLARGTVRLCNHESPHPITALRALRFGAQTGFTHHPDTWNAIQINMPRLNEVTSNESGHAVYLHPRHLLGQELLLGLHHHPAETYRLFASAGALDVLVPDIDANHDETIYEMLSVLHTASLSAKFVGMFLTLEERLADVLERTALRLHIHAAKHRHAQLHHARVRALGSVLTRLHTQHPHTWSRADHERLLHGEHANDLATLLEARASQADTLSDHVLHAHAARTLVQQDITHANEDPLLTSKDLYAIGFRRGPHIRFLLRDVRSAQLEGFLANKNEAIAFVIAQSQKV